MSLLEIIEFLMGFYTMPSLLLCFISIFTMEYVLNSQMMMAFGLLDNYQFWLMTMSCTSMLMAIAAMNNDFYNFKSKNLLITATIMLLVVFQIFLTSNYLIFYVFFELSVIPIFYMISGWGYQPERVFASYILFFYTILASSPLILMLLFMTEMSKKSEFAEMIMCPNLLGNGAYQNVMLFMVFTGFFVKLPVYRLHVWLPKAHVEAPVYGSMLLAAILLKLAGIGMIRFMFFMKSELFTSLMSAIAMLGMTVLAMTCLIITDMKIIIALSSVVHMSFVLIMCLMSIKSSVTISLFVMLTHAFSSSGMFYGAFYLYSRSHSRNILMNKGGLTHSPKMSTSWIIIIMASMGTPPTVNSVSEMLSIMLIVNSMFALWIPLILGFMLSSAFSLILYSSTQQEPETMEFKNNAKVAPITMFNSYFHSLLVLTLVFLLNVMF